MSYVDMNWIELAQHRPNVENWN